MYLSTDYWPVQFVGLIHTIVLHLIYCGFGFLVCSNDNDQIFNKTWFLPLYSFCSNLRYSLPISYHVDVIVYSPQFCACLDFASSSTIGAYHLPGLDERVIYCELPLRIVAMFVDSVEYQFRLRHFGGRCDDGSVASCWVNRTWR